MSSLYLLDTHALIWTFDAPEKLNPDARAVITNRAHTILVSSVSLWEMAIKVSIGRLPAPPADYLSLLKVEGFTILEVSAEHALAVANLPFIHRDPFDRMLVVQAKLSGATLITRDRRLAEYGIRVIAA